MRHDKGCSPNFVRLFFQISRLTLTVHSPLERKYASFHFKNPVRLQKKHVREKKDEEESYIMSCMKTFLRSNQSPIEQIRRKDCFEQAYYCLLVVVFSVRVFLANQLTDDRYLRGHSVVPIHFANIEQQTDEEKQKFLQFCQILRYTRLLCRVLVP